MLPRSVIASRKSSLKMPRFPGHARHEDFLGHRLLALNRAYIDYILPGEFELKTGQLLDILIELDGGASLQNLTKRMFPEYCSVSPKQQLSLSRRTEKILQRARKRYARYGFDIYWSRNLNKFFAVAKALGESYRAVS